MPLIGSFGAGSARGVGGIGGGKRGPAANYTLALTANTTQNFTIPSGVYLISVYTTAGGRVGTGGSTGANRSPGGASGSSVVFEEFEVVGGTTFAVTVGGSGGTSSFGNLSNAGANATSNVAGATITAATANVPNQTQTTRANIGYNTLGRTTAQRGTAGGGGGPGAYARGCYGSSVYANGSSGNSASGSGGSGGYGGNSVARHPFGGQGGSSANAGNPGGNAFAGFGAGGGGGGSGGFALGGQGGCDYNNQAFNSFATGAGGQGGTGLAGQVLIFTR